MFGYFKLGAKLCYSGEKGLKDEVHQGLIREMIGHRCIFIFHSPEATVTHYSHLFPVTRGISLVKGGQVKLPLPSPGGIGGRPEFDTTIHFNLREAA